MCAVGRTRSAEAAGTELLCKGEEHVRPLAFLRKPRVRNRTVTCASRDVGGVPAVPEVGARERQLP